MNSKRGKVKIRLGDGDKFLCYTMNALAELEEDLGTSVTALLGSEEMIREKLGFRTLRSLIWAGVRGAGSRFSLEDVGNMLDPAKFGEYTEIVSSALNAALGAPDENNEPEHLGPTGGQPGEASP